MDKYNLSLSYLDQTVQEFERKYGLSDVYMINFKEKLIKWLNNFKNNDEKIAFLKLLEKYEYYNKLRVRDAFYEMYKQCVKDDLEIAETCILSMCKDDEADSSLEYIGLIREMDRIYRLNFYNDTILYDISRIRGKNSITNILFFDDICGTGGTVIKYIKKNEKLLLNKNVYLNFCVLTKYALNRLNEFKKQYTFIREINFFELKEKSLDDDKVLNENYRKQVENIENSLWGNGSNNILGYKNSQLLITFFHNTPNNTISSFWYSEKFYNDQYKNVYGDQEWNSLFERYRPMKKQVIYSKRERKDKNRAIKARLYK